MAVKNDIINELPGFYDPSKASDPSYSPDMARLFAEAEQWRNRYGLKPAAGDGFKVEILAIDVQNDFAAEGGSLFVAGRSGDAAFGDTRRTAEFIYRNMPFITRITPTMDTHFGIQIFFSMFWVDAQGNNPAPFTVITADDIRKGKWMPNPIIAQFVNGNYTWATKQAKFYAEELEKSGKYALVIWPYHCVLGDKGHSLVGTFQEARMFHSATRLIQSEVEVKGGNPWTENYSVFGAEVRNRWDGQGIVADKNRSLVERLVKNDAVVVLGQAASHCVLWSVDDLLNEIRQMDESLVGKVYVVRDCMSPVVVPGMDFTDATEEAFRRWESEGVNVVESTTDIRDWKGMERIAA